MDSKLQYVVLCSDGTSYAVNNQAAFMERGKQEQPRFDLGKLLEWSPVPTTRSLVSTGFERSWGLGVLFVGMSAVWIAASTTKRETVSRCTPDILSIKLLRVWQRRFFREVGRCHCK
jgi:hypothetical protein